MVVHRRKSHQREVVVDRAAGLLSELIVPTVAPGPQPPLELLTGALDPAAGEIEDKARAERKRQQILSAVGYALPLMRGAGGHAVEFGAGTGHFGLLLAKVRPDWRVTLVEVKEYTAAGARERAASLALPNVSVFQGTVDEFAATHEPFQLAVGLHLCGLLTDAALELATFAQPMYAFTRSTHNPADRPSRNFKAVRKRMGTRPRPGAQKMSRHG